MNLSDRDETQEEQHTERSSESEKDYQTDDEEESDESVSGSTAKLKHFSLEKNQRHFHTIKTIAKSHGGRLNVSLRHPRHSRRYVTKSKTRKYVKLDPCLECSVKNQSSSSENTVQVLQKGKRCRLGGKAKGKPPEEEICEKGDSDEEPDSSYFSRISIGYFQKFNDKSGASTSYQMEETQKSQNHVLQKNEELRCKTSEERELLELQQWGMTSLISSSNKIVEKIKKSEDIRPDMI